MFTTPIQLNLPPGGSAGASPRGGSDQVTPDGCPAPNGAAPEMSNPLSNPEQAPVGVDAGTAWYKTPFPYVTGALLLALGVFLWKTRKMG